MIRFLTGFIGYLAMTVLAACANPADNKPKAVVSEAPSATATVAAGTKLVFTAAEATLDFTGSKVTGSESGSFKQFAGEIELVDNTPEGSRVRVEIEMNSVATKSDGLAEHLKTADFFDVGKFPKAIFVSTEIKAGSDNNASHTVTGTLELHGVKKTISFPATIKVNTDAVTVESEFVINRRDFAINYAGRANDLIRDEVVLKLAVRAPRRKAA